MEAGYSRLFCLEESPQLAVIKIVASEISIILYVKVLIAASTDDEGPVSALIAGSLLSCAYSD